MIPRTRLSTSSYDRPTETITQSIQTKKEIEQQLKDFEEIDNEDLPYINTNTLLRYLSYDKTKKKELYRFGGLLVKVNKDYLILAGKGGLTFSVQRYTKNDNGEIIHTTRFFKRSNPDDILKQQLDETVLKSTEIIEKQNSIIAKQKKELNELRKKCGLK
jgi:hypothetical protein